MQIPSDSIVEEFEACLWSITKTFTLAWTSYLVDDTINILSLEKISNLTRRQ
jgi:hypothetical protein